MVTSESCCGSRRTWIRLRRVSTHTSSSQDRNGPDALGAASVGAGRYRHSHAEILRRSLGKAPVKRANTSSREG